MKQIKNRTTRIIFLILCAITGVSEGQESTFNASPKPNSFDWAQADPTRKAPSEPNSLNWIEVTQTPVSKQVMFDFSSPIYLEKHVDKKNLELQLVFPGMHLGNVDRAKIDAQFDKLKAAGIIETVSISDRTHGVPAVIVALAFTKTKNVVDQATQTPYECPNKLLIRWSKMDDPYRLVLDIFSKDDLEAISHKEALFLHASNSIQSDSQSPTPLPYRIVVDAGHGAGDQGAKGFFGLIEKDLTLDIAKRVQALLEKENANVTLTRDTDREMSLQDRAELAAQLKAHLFVSIHVNSAGKIGSKASGVETFYLEGKELLPPTRSGGIIFVNLAPDQNLINSVDTHLRNSLNLSKNLASCIQKNVISSLEQKNYLTANRGIKSAHFRVLFQNAIPSALVEVGFITNKDECKLFKQDGYRSLLASSISRGIKEFLTSYY